jgi:hypothetical protein
VVFIWGKGEEVEEEGEEGKVFRTSNIRSLSSKVEAGLRYATMLAAFVDS